MTIREQTQEIERRTLSRYATLSENSRGRCRLEKRTPSAPASSGIATVSCTAKRSAA